MSSSAGVGVSDVHAASSQGFSLAANTKYDSGRPTYTDECVDFMIDEAVLNGVRAQLAAEAPTGPPAVQIYRIVDLGAGTGIMTRRLRARLDAFIAANVDSLVARGITFDLVAVEPVEGMRERFAEKSPGLRVEAGSGASMPSVPTGSVDLIVAAQAFHWFATREALAEIARVLKPRTGCFAPIWNTRDTDEPWVAAVDALVDPTYADDVPRQQTGKWKQVFQPTAESRFTLVAQKEWRRAIVQKGGMDMILDRILSISVIAAQPADQQAALKEKIVETIATHPATKGKTEFELPYRTDAYVYRLKE